MELTKQVVSLELAKRLKELGVKQESEFNWNEWDEKIPVLQEKGNFGGSAKDMTPYLMSAFTVGELGEMLPESIVVGEKAFYLTAIKGASIWEIQYEVVEPLESHKYVEALTEADARAKMLIYLIEHKLMPVHDHDCHASSEDGCVCGKEAV